MRVLVVHAHPSTESYSAALAGAAVAGLRRGGHEVRMLDLYREGFRPVMSAEERRAYDTTDAIVSADVADHAAQVRWAEALVFVYPTWWSGLPAILKGWLDRVLVPGVAFELRDQRVRPLLRNIRHIVGITTYGSNRRFVALTGDGGRRTLHRALRMLTARRCRRHWLALYELDSVGADARAAFVRRVETELARL